MNVIKINKLAKAYSIIVFIVKNCEVTNIDTKTHQIKFLVPINLLEDFYGLISEFVKFDGTKDPVSVKFMNSSIGFDLVEILNFYEIDYQKLNLEFI